MLTENFGKKSPLLLMFDIKDNISLYVILINQICREYVLINLIGTGRLDLGRDFWVWDGTFGFGTGLLDLGRDF